ncbi:MAG TPA: heme-binding protein [Solirubrobacteraceae bacterium]|nr:heme-binding protein [Solirubrobacteraceae bacterium]
MAEELTDATASASAPTQTTTNGAAVDAHADGATVAPPVAPPEALPNELPAPLTGALELPSNFEFDEVDAKKAFAQPATPKLGPLAHFTGTFAGNGFNTIFRPDNTVTPTPFPVSPVGPNDNVLELNLTNETLSFSAPLGTVPNRGFVQGDAFLNGVPYLQTINDVTTGSPVGIHFEPGLWIIVPPTKDPKEGSTLARMASIPHGTTINAQGTFFNAHNGPPTIHKSDITPFGEGTTGPPIPFPSQQAGQQNTRRIPQNLSSFITNGTITQAILDDPNTVLREAIVGLNITKTIRIAITTNPKNPLFGGGTDNIAFLWGDRAAVTSASPAGQNAQAALMNATFWIETVERTVTVHPPGAGSLQETIHPAPTAGSKRQPVPRFHVHLPHPISAPVDVKVTYTQLQYTQRVILNFNGLSWPHVSVATLVPSGPVPVPASAFS